MTQYTITYSLSNSTVERQYKVYANSREEALKKFYAARGTDKTVYGVD